MLRQDAGGQCGCTFAIHMEYHLLCSFSIVLSVDFWRICECRCESAKHEYFLCMHVCMDVCLGARLERQYILYIHHWLECVVCARSSRLSGIWKYIYDSIILIRVAVWFGGVLANSNIAYSLFMYTQTHYTHVCIATSLRKTLPVADSWLFLALSLWCLCACLLFDSIISKRKQQYFRQWSALCVCARTATFSNGRRIMIGCYNFLIGTTSAWFFFFIESRSEWFPLQTNDSDCAEAASWHVIKLKYIFDCTKESNIYSALVNHEYSLLAKIYIWHETYSEWLSSSRNLSLIEYNMMAGKFQIQIIFVHIRCAIQASPLLNGHDSKKSSISMWQQMPFLYEQNKNDYALIAYDKSYCSSPISMYAGTENVTEKRDKKNAFVLENKRRQKVPLKLLMRAGKVETWQQQKCPKRRHADNKSNRIVSS